MIDAYKIFTGKYDTTIRRRSRWCTKALDDESWLCMDDAGLKRFKPV